MPSVSQQEPLVQKVLERSSDFQGLSELADHLESKARECDRLQAEGHEAVWRPLEERDAVAHRRALESKGALVRDLPNSTAPVLAKVNTHIAAAVGKVLADYAQVATDLMSESDGTSKYLGLGWLMIPQGSQTGDPNRLEILPKQIRAVLPGESV